MEESMVERGRRGEALVARSLQVLGWRVLDRNWRDGPRELDLVVHREGVLAFVEVKLRRRGGRDRDGVVEEALAAVGFRKRRELELAARAWLASFAAEPLGLRRTRLGMAWPREIRFDVAVVIPDEGLGEVLLIPDAWRPGWGVG